MLQFQMIIPKATRIANITIIKSHSKRGSNSTTHAHPVWHREHSQYINTPHIAYHTIVPNRDAARFIGDIPAPMRARTKRTM